MAQPIVFAPLTNASYPNRNVAFTATAAGSTAPYPPGPQAVAILPTVSGYAIVGKAVTATSANGFPMVAGQVTTLLVPEGDGSPWKVSMVAASTAGTFDAKPINKEGI